MRRTLALALLGASVLSCAAFLARHPAPVAAPVPAAAPTELPPALAHAEPIPHEEAPHQDEASPVAGLDLLRISSDDSGLVAPAEGGLAHLTIDPDLQRTALGLMAAPHPTEAAALLMDVATGRVLVYASRVDRGPARDLCVEATAPSASVFKIVTAAALLEDAHLEPDTKQCYSGGEQRIAASDLVDDPQRDRWCATLASALGRSINAVFARLAKEHIAPSQLEAMARRFGYAQALPFDVPVQPSSLRVPSEPLELARTAAGFWNTTLSPLQAVEMSALVARGGETLRPTIVDKVVSPAGAVLWTAADAQQPRRAVARETTERLSSMMEHTVGEGTSWHAFHDAHGAPFLPGIGVAGKTGTLTDAETHRYYTWFTGFAPVRAQPGEPQVAIAVLVVNGPAWQVKANALARDVLRAYFASRGAQGVTRPSVMAIARHHKR